MIFHTTQLEIKHKVRIDNLHFKQYRYNSVFIKVCFRNYTYTIDKILCGGQARDVSKVIKILAML